MVAVLATLSDLIWMASWARDGVLLVVLEVMEMEHFLLQVLATLDTILRGKTLRCVDDDVHDFSNLSLESDDGVQIMIGAGALLPFSSSGDSSSSQAVEQCASTTSSSPRKYPLHTPFNQ